MADINPAIQALATPVGDLVPYPGNARRGNIARIAESLQANGQYRPIVVRRGTDEVLAGNHTLAAAKQLGWDAVAVTFVEVTDDEARRIVLVDNKTNDDAAYDDQELIELLQSLPSLEGTGFTPDELDLLLTKDDDTDDLLDDADSAGDADGFTKPDVISSPGDVWILGDGHEVAFLGDAEQGWIIDAMVRYFQKKTQVLPVLKRTGDAHDFLSEVNNGD